MSVISGTSADCEAHLIEELYVFFFAVLGHELPAVSQSAGQPSQEKEEEGIRFREIELRR